MKIVDYLGRRWRCTAGEDGVLHGLPLSAQLHDLVEGENVLLLPVPGGQYHGLSMHMYD
jgi:hypothetical protein